MCRATFLSWQGQPQDYWMENTASGVLETVRSDKAQLPSETPERPSARKKRMKEADQSSAKRRPRLGPGVAEVLFGAPEVRFLTSEVHDRRTQVRFLPTQALAYLPEKTRRKERFSGSVTA